MKSKFVYQMLCLCLVCSLSFWGCINQNKQIQKEPEIVQELEEDDIDTSNTIRYTMKKESESEGIPQSEAEVLDYLFEQTKKIPDRKNQTLEEIQANAEKDIPIMNKLSKNGANMYLVQTPTLTNGYQLIIEPVDAIVASDVKVIGFDETAVYSGYIEQRTTIDMSKFANGNYLVKCVGKVLKFVKK